MGGTPTFVWRDQGRMTPAMARDWDSMAAAFLRDNGCRLLASSGIRTDQEQLDIWYDRYVPSNKVNGRRVYDWRWWNGILWARISSAGTVAQPRTSNHQLNVPAGRRGAVDARDSGSDPGVTRFGTARHAWMVRNGPRYGFNTDEGTAVNEAWHLRYMRDPFRSVPSPTPKPKPPIPEPSEPILEEVEMSDVHVIRDKARGEWTQLDPDVGLDLPRVVAGKDAEFRTEKTPGGVVNVYRGFMVTNDPAVGNAWSRTFCRAYKNVPLDLTAKDYVDAQRESSRLSVERHPQ